MTKFVTIEGGRFYCYMDTLDDAGRLKPGFYVRDSGLGRLIALADPIWSVVVRERLPVGLSVRNLIAVGADHEPTIIESTTVEVAVDGGDWSADVIFAPSNKRRESVKMTLPFGRKPPALMAAADREEVSG